MSKERLLKRIAMWAKSEESMIESDLIILKNAVLEDLDKLYNTQRGTVLTDENFGLPNFTNLINGFSPPELGRITLALHDMTQKYEMRLKNIFVEEIPREDNMGLLKFVIKGDLQYRGQPASVSYLVVLQGDGSVVIEQAE